MRRAVVPSHVLFVSYSTAALLAAGLFACAPNAGRYSYSGTIQADSASVGSITGGRVAAVLAADGQRVAKGTLLVRFDDRQLRAAYDAALAQESQAKAALQDLTAGPRQAEIDKAAATAAQAQAVYRHAQLNQPQQIAAAVQAVHAAQADLISANGAASKAARDYARARRLFDQGAVSAQAMDAARASALAADGQAGAAAARLRAAEAQLAADRSGAVAQDVEAAARAAAAAQANLALVQAGARPDQVAQARAALNAASANKAAAFARLDETRVTSPADGVVDGLDIHAGDLIAPGAPVTTIDEFGDPWVRIYVTQADLGRFRVNATAGVRSDALGGRTFTGTIETIDARAQFTPRDVQTASDRADLSFGVKVRVHDPDRVLRAGTTVEVSLP
jgi:membrane fusion protein YbhG